MSQASRRVLKRKARFLFVGSSVKRLLARDMRAWKMIQRFVASSAIAIFIVACASTLRDESLPGEDLKGAHELRSRAQLVESHPRDATAHYKLAEALYQKYTTDFAVGRSHEADLQASLNHFSRAIEINALYAEAYSQRGVVRSVLGDEQGAREDYEKAIAINPYLEATFFNRAHWFERQNRYSEAIADYEKFISLSADDAWRKEARKRIDALKVKDRIRRITGASELGL